LYGSIFLVDAASTGVCLVGGAAVSAAQISNFHERKGGASNMKGAYSGIELLEETVSPLGSLLGAAQTV
jgi:hypothetical protein